MSADTLPGLIVHSTTSMQDVTQHVSQHSWCGTVVVTAVGTGGAHLPLGSCPARCDRPDDGWWEQSLPVAGIHTAADDIDTVARALVDDHSGGPKGWDRLTRVAQDRYRYYARRAVAALLANGGPY